MGLPLFVHFHGYDVSQCTTLVSYQRAYRRLAGRTAAFIVPSQYLADRLAGIGIPRDHLHVVPCGVEPAEFPFAGRPADGQRVLAVGRLVDKKAPHLLIAAFAGAATSRPDAILEIIGDGPLMDRCRAEVEARDLAGRVVLHGPRPHAFVKERMRAATVFAQHSVTASNGDTEGLPVAILEAMMSGLPVVSTRHAGIPEAVLDGETGCLVDEGDVAGMGRAIEALLADPRRAGRMGEAGHARAIGHFTHAASIARLRRLMGLETESTDAPSESRLERATPAAREPLYEC
jgi:glycosyltransferase involved in cell wall biosynthesis